MSTPPQDPPTAPSATTPDDAPPKRYLDAPTAQPPNNFPPRALPALAAAASLIRVDDFKTAHTKPCFRDANLWGMATGFAFGGVRFIFGGSHHHRTTTPTRR